MNFVTVLQTELWKLHRSLAVLLVVVAPSVIGLFVFLGALSRREAASWAYWMQSATGLWAVFMLPMSLTALALLFAHIEHGARAWDHLRSTPVSRFKIYLGKAVATWATGLAMSAGVLLITTLVLMLAGVFKEAAAPTGGFEPAAYAEAMVKVFLSATLLMAVQFWLAVRFANFVPSLAVGMGGTFFAVVATGAKQGVFIPWQMPVNTLAADPQRANLALLLGFALGVAGFLIAIIHLARRDVP